MPRTRPPYPEEFKREAIEFVRLTGKSIRQVARDLGISEVSLRNWVKQAGSDAGERPGGLSSDEREELQRLRRENQTLRMEREILKKAAAFFAKGGRSSSGRLPSTCEPNSSSTRSRWGSPAGVPAQASYHSDQGSQYVSLGFGQAARNAGIAISMGSRGDAYDNAVAESFFATLKKELVHRRSWPTRRELGSAVFEYIEAFYNRERRHSTLGMLSPAEYERTQERQSPSR